MPLPCVSPPRVVATIGLHASASTWVFNVVREMMIAGLGEAAVTAVYADDMTTVPDDAALGARHLVIKSHHGSAALDEWLAAGRAPLILSVRDPRDACVSMVQRFGSPLGYAVQWIANDCNRLARLAARGHKLLRYEDHFFAHSVAAEDLARTLELPVAEGTIKLIAARYGTDSVRRFAQSLAALPDERVTRVSPSHLMDRVTQIHTPHIGDGRSGKWRDLPDATGNELTRVFSPFLDQFGYPR